MKQKTTKKLRFLSLIAVLLLASVLLSACSSASSGGDNYYPKDEMGASTDDGSNIVVGNTNRKIVYTVTLRMQSETPETVGDAITAATKEYNGYIQSSETSVYSSDSSYFYYVVRIPTESLDAFVDAISSSGNVRSKEISTVDITTKYVNAEATKESLTAEKEALQQYLASPEATLDDILKISERIQEIDAELTATKKELENFDSLLDYSTVNISISKTYVEETDDRSFGQKLSDLFKASFKSIGTVAKGIVIALTAAFPYLLILAAIAGIVLFFVIGTNNRKKTGKFFPQRKSKKKEEDGVTAESIEQIPDAEAENDGAEQNEESAE